MKKFKIIFLVALFFSSQFSPGFILQAENEDTVYCIVGETKTFSTRNPTRVVIGNPAIADIAEVTSSEIKLSAKAPGSTTLVYWDIFGEQSVIIRVSQDDIVDIKHRVDSLLKDLGISGVYTKLAGDEGKVMLLGSLKNSADKERIISALAGMKQGLMDLIVVKEEDTVIEIDVQVLELDKGASKTLGLTWPSQIILNEVNSPSLSAVTSAWGTLFKTVSVTRAAFQLTLDALEQEGKARILSRPRLSCLSGKEAKLLVGGEKPIYTATTTASSSAVTTGSVDYKEYGIILNIKPRVMEDNRIKINLTVEVSEAGEYDSGVIYAKAFPITKRTVNTELFVNNNQTLAVGGLMKRKTEESMTKTPGLSNLPLIGALFRKKTTTSGGGASTKSDTELYITLTPRIVPKEEVPEEKLTALKKAPEEFGVQAVNIPQNIAPYARAVQAKITSAAYYPRQAKDAGWEGSVRLSLNLTANGSLKEMKVLQSSGYKLLDDAAAQVVRAQAPYPPFPPQIDAQEIWIEVPIVFKKS
ncbi:MAG: TonB family protein [Candidatus Omnitrophota bacterium]